jgi:4-amino-4-deoxy-L-arabinose transferase-like glycosyltransferase
MDEKEQTLEKRKQAVFNWLKNPLNLSLTIVLIIAFAIRLYYFLNVGNQPLWWDEACYGSLARNMVTGDWAGTALIVGEGAIRPPFFPFVWSLFMRMHFSELAIRFVLEFLPSVLTVFFVYLVGKEVFGKRAGVIAAFMFSVLWIHLFYTIRFLTNIPALAFLFLSIYLFILSTKNKLNYKLLGTSLVLLSISTLFRYPNGLIFFVYFVMLIIGKQLNLNKLKFWMTGLIGLIPIWIFFIFNFITKGNIFPALLGKAYLKPDEAILRPLGFSFLNYIPIYLRNVFFVLFLIGLVIVLFELIIGYNFIPKNKKLQNYLHILLILIIIFSFFIFFLRIIEDRWLFATALPLVCIAALGIDKCYLFIKKYNKYLAVILLIGILIFGAYPQIKTADDLITVKKGSYIQMRQAFEWIKATTPEDTVIAGLGIEPYLVYYSGRQQLPISHDESDKEKIKDADYLIQHAFIGQPPYLGQYIQDNQDKLTLANVFFFDAQQKQPAVIIYKVNK